MLLKSIKANLLRRELQSPLANLLGGNQVCIELDLSRINWTDLSNRWGKLQMLPPHPLLKTLLKAYQTHTLMSETKSTILVITLPLLKTCIACHATSFMSHHTINPHIAIIVDEKCSNIANPMVTNTVNSQKQIYVEKRICLTSSLICIFFNLCILSYFTCTFCIS